MKLLYKLQQSKKTKKVLYILISIFVFAYIFLIPSFGESSSNLNLTIYAALALLTATVFLYCLLYSDFKTNKFVFLIPLFAIFAFIGTLFYSHEFRRWFSLILLTISFLAFLLSFKILDNRFLIIHIISIALCCFSLFFIIHYRSELIHFADFASGSFRLGDYFDNPNGVAAFEVVAFASSLYCLIFYKKKRRFFHLIPLVLSAIVGISTGSRSFILAIALFLIVFLFFVFKKRRWLYLIILAALIGSFIGFLQLPFMSTIKERFIIAFETLLGTGTKVETSTLTRVLWAYYGFFLGLKNGLIGYGANGFSIFSGVGTYAHNNYAEVICDFGIIGFIVFYSPLLVLLFYAIKNKGVDKPLIISFVLYYFIISLSNIFYYKKIYYVILAFLYYLVFIESSKCVKKIKQPIKKIVFTCDTMGPGGAEKVISILSNSFSRNGIDITIIGVSDELYPSVFYKIESKIKYISLNYGLKKRTKFFKRALLLRKTIKNESPDVVISFLPHVNAYTYLSLIGTNIPFIVSERNDPSRNPSGVLKRLLKRLAFVGADGCVFQTENAKSFYKESIKNKSVVIPNPFIPSIEVTHSKKNDIILSVGRLTEQKNLVLLLEGFALSRQNLGDQFCLRIYGDGPLRQQLEKKAIDLSIRDKVQFLGLDNNWQNKEYDDALFILTSNYEGMPNSLVEALSLGIPCISTDCPCGGPSELKEKGFNISLVPLNNPEILSQTIVETIKKYKDNFDNENTERCSQFNPTIICKKWLDYLSSI